MNTNMVNLIGYVNFIVAPMNNCRLVLGKDFPSRIIARGETGTISPFSFSFSGDE